MITHSAKQQLKAWWANVDTARASFIINVLENKDKIPKTDDVAKHWFDVDYKTEKMMAIIDNTKYLAESVPFHYVNFGGLPLCACLGGELEFVDKDATWNKEFIENLDDFLQMDVVDGNPWWKMLKEETRRSAVLSHNHHYTTQFAFSGVGDIISGCMGIVPYMMALMQSKEKMHKITSRMTDIWIRLFNEINDIIDAGENDGYVSSWSGIWAPGKTFPIQEDIAYMISPQMFDEFALPYIDRQAQEMEYAFYHLDGKGQIPFVASLASLDSLKAIQWLPGAGNWKLSRWYDLIKLIKSKNVAVQVFAKDPDEVKPLIKEVGTKGLLISVDFDDIEKAYRFLDKYKIL